LGTRNRRAEDVLDTVLDFVPIVGGGKDIYQGIQDGNGWMVALGVGSIILDVGTLGGSSIVKGLAKTGIKAGGRSLTKKVAKSALKKGASKTTAFRSIGAAAKKVFNPKNFKGVSASFLNKNGISNIHAFKADFLGTTKNLRLFDVVKHTGSNELLIIRKSTQEVVERTYIIVK